MRRIIRAIDGGDDSRAGNCEVDRVVGIRHKRAMLGRARTWFERMTKAKLEVADMVKAQARLGDVDKLNVPPKDPAAP